jgi:type II secretory pathway pseudopilin PulG
MASKLNDTEIEIIKLQAALEAKQEIIDVLKAIVEKNLNDNKYKGYTVDLGENTPPIDNSTWQINTSPWQINTTPYGGGYTIQGHTVNKSDTNKKPTGIDNTCISNKKLIDPKFTSESAKQWGEIHNT